LYRNIVSDISVQKDGFASVYSTHLTGPQSVKWEHHLRYQLKGECLDIVSWPVSQWKANADIENTLSGITICARSFLRDLRALSVVVTHKFEEVSLGISSKEKVLVQGDR